MSSENNIDIRQMRIGNPFILFLSLMFLTTACAVAADFTVESRGDRLIITHNNRPVAQYVFRDEKIFRPYFAHVHTPDGIQVTRNHPPLAGKDSVDHDTMHPGIWLAFGDISGQDFWRNKATIRHERFVESPSVRDGKLMFTTSNTLLATNKKTLARLISDFTLTSRTDGFLLIWDASFTPATDGFAFGDQEEMGFGIRVATPISEKNGGLVRNSDGLIGAKNTWGKTAAWCDYSGLLGNRLVGIAVMHGPKNVRLSWFHSRDYGLIVANPFGRKAFTREGEPSRVSVRQGETFTLRFAAFTHSTPTNRPPDIMAAFQSFVSQK
jgi:hypothetical protein